MKYHSKSIFLCLILGILLLDNACQSSIPSDPIMLLFTQPSPLIQAGKMIQLSSHDTTGGNNDRIPIKPGEKVPIANIKGEGMIARIWVTVDSRDPDYLRTILIRMFWDGEENPSVEVPLGDFFGSPFQYQHHLPKYVGMSSGGYYSYFPMPFKNGAVIEIENQGREEVYALYYQINYYELEKNSLPKEIPYFHAQWKRDVRTESTENYVALYALGKGFFAGLNFNGQPYDGRLFYLEGDEMIFVDGEAKPSVYGTGMEDYFTAGWYFQNGPFAADYHGLTFLDPETGRVTAYRHHIPDAIPFKNSIKVTFEHGHGNEEVVDLSTTAFWYQTEPHQKFNSIGVPGQRMVLKRPISSGVIAPNAFKVRTDLDFEIRDMTQNGPDWIGNEQLIVKGKDGASFSIILDQLEEAAYEIEIYYSKAPEFGTTEIGLNGKRLMELEALGTRLQAQDKIYLGEAKPNSQKEIVLDFRFMEGGSFGLDAVLLTPKRNFITDWYLIGPFPNLRVHDYERPGLDSAYFPEKEIHLDTTYPGYYGDQLAWFRVNDGKSGYDMRLRQYFEPTEFIVIYGLTYVFSPLDQQVIMFVGSDDAAKVFINDEEVYRFFDLMRIAAPDQDRVEVTLKKGWNKVLVKAENNFGGFAFYLRFMDPTNSLIVNAQQKFE